MGVTLAGGEAVSVATGEGLGVGLAVGEDVGVTEGLAVDVADGLGVGVAVTGGSPGLWMSSQIRLPSTVPINPSQVV